jgi:DNA-binding GntR family transcriptional regulator
MENHIFNPRKKIILSQDIYQTLREAILDGKLETGSRLVESSIASQMGVSRAPLREAIRLLEKDGLVVIEAHRETRVISLTLNDIQELHLIRTNLETLLFQYASRKIKQDELIYLEELVEKIETAAKNRNANLLGIYDYEFHDQLCQIAGWPRLYRIWKDQHVLLRLWFNEVAKVHDNFIEATAKDHRVMFNAISEKDNHTIEKEVFNHIYYSGPAFKEDRYQWANEIKKQMEEIPHK